MARPLYESGEDRDAEDAIMAEVSLRYPSLKPHKLPLSYAVDYALVRGGKVRSYAEVKRRRNPKHKYETLLLSLNKVLRGLELARLSGATFVLFVKWDDTGPQYLRVREPLNVQIGGRADRGDSQDIEPVAHFPVSGFAEIE